MPSPDTTSTTNARDRDDATNSATLASEANEVTDLTTPDFVYAGASRCGSTWLQQALRDHPEIELAPTNPVSFFDLRYQRGLDWYGEQLPDAGDGSVVGESSPGYMKHPFVPERLAKTCPDVKVLFTVRNPVDRAFSEWWHERSFDHVTWDFEGALDHHPAFDTFLRPGYYAHHLERFDRYFDESQLAVHFFEDFTEDNEAYVQEIYEFLGVDSSYTPTVVGERVNEANHLSPRLNRFKSWVHGATPDRIRESVVEPAYRPVKRFLEADSAYKRGVPDDVRSEMEAVFVEDVRALEERTGRDLGGWIEHADPST